MRRHMKQFFPLSIKLKSLGLVLQILYFNDWVKMLAYLDKDKGEGINFIKEMTTQILTLTKSLQNELTKFETQGSKLSNHLQKLCGLEPTFIAAPTIPILPQGWNIFNTDLAALEAICSFQNDMCTMIDSRILEIVPSIAEQEPRMSYEST